MKIKTQKEVEADECGVLMCNTVDLPSPFDDNVTGECADCGAAIYWRPHNPTNLKRMCVPCAMKMAAAQQPENQVEFCISEVTASEVNALISQNKIA